MSNPEMEKLTLKDVQYEQTVNTEFWDVHRTGFMLTAAVLRYNLTILR